MAPKGYEYPVFGLHTTTVSGASVLTIEYMRAQTCLKAVGCRPYTIQLPLNYCAGCSVGPVV